MTTSPTSVGAFRGTVVDLDNHVLAADIDIHGQRSRRGTGDGKLWRGRFDLAETLRGPTLLGQTLYLRFQDRSQVGMVVTEVVDHTVYFRARGKMPTFEQPAAFE